MPEDTTEVHINIRKVHADIFKILMPYFGNTLGEIIYNLALRWIESNIGTPQIKELIAKRPIEMAIGIPKEKAGMKKEQH